jgi:hypothetical protein
MFKLAIFDKIIINLKSKRTKLYFKIFGFVLLIAFINKDYLIHTFFRSDLIINDGIKARNIRRELKSINDGNKCDYVAISLFGNGTKSLNGIHFKSMTRKWEARKDGNANRAFYYQKYDIEPFEDHFLKLSKNKRYVYIKDVEDYQNQYIGVMLKKGGYKSVLYFPVFDIDFWGREIFVGFISFEYFKKTNFSESDIEIMRSEYNVKLKNLIKK